MSLSLVRRMVCVLGFASSLALAACGSGGGGGGGGSPGSGNEGGGDGGGGEPPAIPVSTLAGLTISEGTLAPAFSPDTFEYVVGPALLDGTVTLTPTASDPQATVMVQGVLVTSGAPTAPLPLPATDSTIAVAVTSSDGGSTTTYNVTFSRRGPTSRDAYVKASNTGLGDQFGASIAVDGDTMVVGAPGESSAAVGVDAGAAAEADDRAPQSGAAYVYVRVGGAWARQAYLKASNTGAGDKFGCAVAISGDTIVVGALREASWVAGVNAGPADQADDSSPGAGAAYVFVRNGSTWTQQAYLKASNPRGDTQFGRSVAVSGDTIVVGSDLEDGAPQGATLVMPLATPAYDDAGAAYVFTRSGVTWSQQGYLKATVKGSGDRFGTSVAVSGDTIVVGAPFEDSSATGTNWGADDDSAPDSGAAYVFQRSGGAWTQTAYVKPLVTHIGAQFGTAVSISGDQFAVGAPFEDGAGVVQPTGAAGGVITDSGAVCVFGLVGGWWEQTMHLTASNRDIAARFGSSVSISGDTLLVGAPGDASAWTVVDTGFPEDTGRGAPESGAAYVFLGNGGVFSQAAYVKASNTGSFDWFGTAVSTANGTVVVGAPGEDSSATGVNPGAAAEADNSAPKAGAAYILR